MRDWLTTLQDLRVDVTSRLTSCKHTNIQTSAKLSIIVYTSEQVEQILTWRFAGEHAVLYNLSLDLG